MMNGGNIGISKIDKEHLINLLTEELPVFRAMKVKQFLIIVSSKMMLSIGIWGISTTPFYF